MARTTWGPSLGTRIFLISALLILLSVTPAVVLTSVLGGKIARKAVDDSLAKSHSVQSAFQQQRYEQLQLISRLFVADPYLTAFLAEAIEDVDTRSILDILDERRDDFGFDFAIVLDPDGVVVARTDRPDAAGEDLYERPLVARAIEEYEASGVWSEGERLFSTVVTPLVQDLDLLGYLVAGFEIGDIGALEVKRISGAEVAYLRIGGTESIVATTLDADFASRLVTMLDTVEGLSSVVLKNQAVNLEIDLDGSPWLALLSPLHDAKGGVVGATVALASLDDKLKTFRDIRNLLLLVGVLSILVAWALSYTLSRRTLEPLRQLAEAAEAAREGDYDRRLEIKRGDEIGRLGRSFNAFLSELREKRDMESYVTELARTMPESGPGGEHRAASSRDLALLGIDMRRYADGKLGFDPDEDLSLLATDLRRVAITTSGHGGRIEGAVGHVVLVSFEGEGKSFRALASGAELVGLLSVRQNAFDNATPPVVAIVEGDVLTGSVVLEDHPESVVVGKPLAALNDLLRQASPGEIVLSPELHASLGPAMERSGLRFSPQAGEAGTSFFRVSPEAAATLTGIDIQATAVVSKAGTLAPVVADDQATLAQVGPGSVLAERFEILSVLGAGGMGVVYKARDRELDDLVALKMLKREVAGDRELISRFKEELKLARRITHPNVLRTFDFGEVNGLPYISMEYVRGITLRYLLDQAGRLPYSAGLRLARQLCSGLRAAHAVGVVHRDIKPENMILDSTGNARLMDFGIARPIRKSDTQGRTEPGMIVGTPHYLAPEQCRGEDVDQRADLYAVGVVLFQIFTGKLPFTGSNPMQILVMHLNEAPPSPRSYWGEMPEDLERIILKCLEKDANDRYQTVEDLMRELGSLSA